MSISLDAFTFKDLIELKSKLADAMIKAKANEAEAFRQECVQMAAKRGLEISDIFGKIPRAKVPVPAKFQHPKNGKTWSGRGRTPLWLRGDLAKYAIGNAPAQPLKSAHSETLRGPKAPYRDPVSGKTWSGNGRAPFWIVGKDRSKFSVSA